MTTIRKKLLVDFHKNIEETPASEEHPVRQAASQDFRRDLEDGGKFEKDYFSLMMG